MEIQTFQKRGTGGQLTKVVLSDGSSFFISSLFIEGNGLHEGDAVSEELFHALRYQSELQKAREKGLDLLSRAEHSEGMMRRKLLKRKFRTEVITEVIDWLKERNYLENRRYAEQWVSVRLRKNPEGKPALVAGLLKRGVDRGTAEDTVDELLTPETEAAALTRALDKLKRRYGEDTGKIYNGLLRKGFSSVEINSQLERFSRK